LTKLDNNELRQLKLSI